MGSLFLFLRKSDTKKTETEKKYYAEDKYAIGDYLPEQIGWLGRRDQPTILVR